MLYVNNSCILTLLIKRSVWSKCRPYIFGASPGGDSIFTHTSMPLRASVSGLWLASMPVTTPTSRNYKTKTFSNKPITPHELWLAISHWESCSSHRTSSPSGREGWKDSEVIQQNECTKPFFQFYFLWYLLSRPLKYFTPIFRDHCKSLHYLYQTFCHHTVINLNSNANFSRMKSCRFQTCSLIWNSVELFPTREVIQET